MTVTLDWNILWSLIPQSVFLLVIWYSFRQKIKEIAKGEVSSPIKELRDQVLAMIDKVDLRHDTRITMLDAKLHTTDQSLATTREIVKALEAHNEHILKTVDGVADSITRIHERLDKYFGK